MKVRDKNLNEDVNVVSRECLWMSCYKPRRDPGVFVQGRGYRERPGGNGGMECGRREVHGCPDNPGLRAEKAV